MKKALKYILLKDTKVHWNKCRNILCWWRGYLDIIKNSVPHKLTYKFNTYYQAFIMELDELIH